MAVTAISATAITGRYEVSILTPRNGKDAANLAILASAIAIVSAAVLAVFSYILPPHWTAKLGLDSIAEWLPFAFIAAAATAIITTGQAWLNRCQKYTNMAYIRIAQSCIIAIGAIGFSKILPSLNGLIIAQIVGCLCTALLTLVLARPLLKLRDLKRLKPLASKHSSSPKLLLPTAILDVASLQLPLFLIAAKFGPEIAGHLSMATRVLSIPLMLAGTSIGQVFFQKAAQDIDDAPRKVMRLYILISVTLATASIAPALLIACYGELIFSWALGPNWNEAGKLASWLVVSATMYFVFSPTSSVLIVLQRQRLLLGFGVAQFTYRLAAAIIAPDINEYIRTIVILEVVNVLTYTIMTSLLLNRHSQSLQP